MDDVTIKFYRVVITGEPSLPSLVKVITILVGLGPSIVLELGETGGKHNGKSLVV